MKNWKGNLVRLFLNDEAPSQVGLGIQDYLQAKTSSHLHPTSFEDNLPPGFEGVQPTNLSNNLLLEVPTIKWKCPPKLIVDLTWHVAAGEESQEVEAENHRGLRVLEAIYPRPSSIPPNAVVSVDVKESQNDYQQPPLIPITPIEEEDVVVDLPYDPMQSKQIGSQGQVAASGGFSTPVYVGNNSASTSSSDRLFSVAAPGLEPGVLAAASATYAAIMKTNQQGNLIDQELLVQILSDRNLAEKLVNGYGASNLEAPQHNLPPANLANPPSAQNSRPELSKPAVPVSSSNAPLYLQPNKVLHPIVQGPPPVPVPPAKDINYYKCLIQKHGEDRQEVPQQFGSRTNSQYAMNQDHQRNNPHASKPKIMKPCIYFNTARGCIHGANCSYQHDTSFQQRVNSMPDAKRMKMDREITGA
uniref:C3H1-type domain-containing protein n=1 Tax=Kalanchoe fedtschenkoi TaxID=63787 RepID=A0A7N1A9R0_KALFE